jgi:hypothetical protein
MISTALLAEGLTLHPIGKVIAVALFYVTLAWLPLRGMAALLLARRHRARRRRSNEWPGYHVGMKILPPM